MNCSMPNFPIHHQLPELSQTHVHPVGDDIQPSHPVSSLSLLYFSISKSVLHIRWPKSWSFSFNISPSNEYSVLIPSIIDWLDLLAVQGTQVFSNTKVQNHQFFNAQPSLWSILLEKPKL